MSKKSGQNRKSKQFTDPFPKTGYLLDEKLRHFRKPPSLDEILAILEVGEFDLPPVQFELIHGPHSSEENLRRYDGLLNARWGDKEATFVFEYKSGNTPRQIDEAVAQVQRYASSSSLLNPLIIVPYLSEERLKSLEHSGISAVDLCGNGVLTAQPFSVFRSGQENLYKSGALIKNVYRGTSSMFARTFLEQPREFSLGEIYEKTNDRVMKRWAEPQGGLVSTEESRTRYQMHAPLNDYLLEEYSLSKSTGWKVAQAMAEEMLLARIDEHFRLVNPEGLLDNLLINFQDQGKRTFKGKTDLPAFECWRRLHQVRNDPNGFRNAATGVGSAGLYGVLSSSNMMSLNVADLDRAIELLEATPTKVFPNIEIFEVTSDLPYFDVRRRGPEAWASPLQTWLELNRSGPRERDAAQVLYRDLVRGTI